MNIIKRSNPTLNNKWITLIALILILGLSIYTRVQWISSLSVQDTNIGYDGFLYDRIAKNLIDKNGFGYSPNSPSSWRPPGYPFFLYTAYSIFSDNIFIVRILQCFLGTGICLILFKLSKKVAQNFPNKTLIALLAALFYAINYHAIIINQFLLSELFTSFLITLSIYFMYMANESKDRVFYIASFLSSLFLWYAILTRPSNILFWFWIGLWFIVENKNNYKRIFSAIVMVIIGFCIIILPWTIRNYVLHKKFLLISSNGGFVFFMSHHPHSKGGFIEDGPHRYTQEQKLMLKNLSEVERDKKHYKFGFDFIKNNLKKELELILLKQKLLWTSRSNPRVFIDFLIPISFPLLTFHFLFVFSIPCLIIAARNFKNFFLPMAYILNHSFIISFLFFYDGWRTRIEMLPMLSIFASIGFVSVFIGIFKIVNFFRIKKEFKLRIIV